jgi:hypothetical protein
MSHFCGACGQYDGPLSHVCGPTLPESEVVVSRTDLEWALRLIENVHTVTWPNAKDVPYVEFDRLRAVLNTENQT